MTGLMESEKRRHARIQVGIALDIRVKGEAVKKCRGTIADLSMSGMTFKSDALLEKGQSLYLKMNLPLEIRGEIRNIEPGSRGGMHRYGVRFHHIGFENESGGKPADDFFAARFQRPSVN
jgi:hypothetical protein